MSNGRLITRIHVFRNSSKIADRKVPLAKVDRLLIALGHYDNANSYPITSSLGILGVLMFWMLI
jgi:hypothetical protein